MFLGKSVSIIEGENGAPLSVKKGKMGSILLDLEHKTLMHAWEESTFEEI